MCLPSLGYLSSGTAKARSLANPLRIAALVATVCAATLSLAFLVVPLLTEATQSWAWAAALSGIGLGGAAAGALIGFTDRRWSGLLLALLFLAAALSPPVAITTLHWYGPVALVMVVLGVWKAVRLRAGQV